MRFRTALFLVDGKVLHDLYTIQGLVVSSSPLKKCPSHGALGALAGQQGIIRECACGRRCDVSLSFFF